MPPPDYPTPLPCTKGKDHGLRPIYWKWQQNNKMNSSSCSINNKGYERGKQFTKLLILELALPCYVTGRDPFPHYQ